MSSSPASSSPAGLAPAGIPPQRRNALALVAGLIVLGGIGYAGWRYLAPPTESTDNAYVQADVVQITPQVAGTVTAIQADDTDFVKAGQALVNLDAADARIALQQAEAQLARTVRDVRALYANSSGGQAQVQLRSAEVTRAQAEVNRLQDDLNRRTPLQASGAVGGEEVQHTRAQLDAARSTLAAAQSALAAAREQLGASSAQVDGLALEQHPAVQQAAARLRETHLALSRAVLPAPVDGYIARRSVQLGQRVQPGAPLMAVVGLQQMWVDANFKESQLQRIRIGQPAELQADVYGKQVVFHGKVVGLGAGTGSAFALLPAQNATGNWIKIVQRVPVRIALDPKELAEHPLRVGLSMLATVDVAKQDGRMLADAPRSQPLARTSVFDAPEQAADEAVQRIIAANLRSEEHTSELSHNPASRMPSSA
jgi:membrane fusion protein (multidrug efflux system)